MIKNQFNDSILINPVFKYGDHEIPKFIGIPVFISDVFIGRDDELENVYQKLFEGDNLLLLVNGEGGIGKTALAAHYYNKYADRYCHLAWIFAEKSLLDALLTLALPLGVSFPDQSSEDERLYLLLQAMRQLKKPCLLVIDNANDLNELENHFNFLHSCPNFHFLITTRVSEFEHAETFKIQPLSDEDAENLFIKLYPIIDDNEKILLKNILEAIGKNTLVIEILAKNLYTQNRIRIRYKLNDLLNDLKGKGLFCIETQEVSTTYHEPNNVMRKENPETIITAMYNLSELNKEERQLLSVFAVLPAKNINFTKLEFLLTNKKSLVKSLLNLSKNGWLDFNEFQNEFKVSPVIQEITKKKNIELTEDCEPLINRLIDILEYYPGIGHLKNINYYEADIYVQYAENIYNTIKDGNDRIAILSERVGNYYLSIGNVKKALSYFKNYYQFTKGLFDQHPDNLQLKNWLAISYNKLIEVYNAMGDTTKIIEYSVENLKLTEQLCQEEPHNVSFKIRLANSYSQLSEAHIILGNWDKVIVLNDIYSKITIDLIKAYPQDFSIKTDIAVLFSRLGDTQRKLGNLNQALIFHKNETDIFEKLISTEPLNVSYKTRLSISYEKLGSINYALRNLNESLTFFDKFYKLSDELYKIFPENMLYKSNLAISYERLGSTHSLLGNLERALFYNKNRLIIAEELYETFPQHISFKNGLAIAYNNLGVFYRDRLCNRKTAKIFFLKAKALRSELSSDFPENETFNRYLEQVEDSLKKSTFSLKYSICMLRNFTLYAKKNFKILWNKYLSNRFF